MGGANSQQAHDVVLTSMRRNDVESMSRFLINQCQIITFLILKSDNIENSRIDLKWIILQVPSSQIKVTFIIFLPFNLVHLWFFPVSHRNWRKMWMNYWGPKGMLPPPLKLLGGGAGLPCPPPLSSYAYDVIKKNKRRENTTSKQTWETSCFSGNWSCIMSESKRS